MGIIKLKANTDDDTLFIEQDIDRELTANAVTFELQPSKGSGAEPRSWHSNASKQTIAAMDWRTTVWTLFYTCVPVEGETVRQRFTVDFSCDEVVSDDATEPTKKPAKKPAAKKKSAAKK